jgi:hypothetical protein
MAGERVQRRLTAILAADIAGYSRLMGADEEGTLAQLKAHRHAQLDPKIEEHQGRIVKTTGDGMLAEFASVVDALRCAIEIQRGMLERNADVPQERRIEFRIGINVGDIIIDGGDIYGDGVNVAARWRASPNRVGSAFRAGCRKMCEASSISPSRMPANSSSRTSPGQCGSTGCGSAAKQPSCDRPWRFPTSLRSPSCRSPT